MFIKYNPDYTSPPFRRKEDELVYCKCCGIVLHKQTIEQNVLTDKQHTYIECPVCGCKENIK